MTVIRPEAVGLVPELEVSELAASLCFYVSLLGFTVLYDRTERPFAYLTRGAAHIMLEQGGTWQTGALERPFGRGINFQVAVADVDALAARLQAAAWPLFGDIEEAWYRRGEQLVGERLLLVQDPDGYLLRFSQHLGVRPV